MKTLKQRTAELTVKIQKTEKKLDKLVKQLFASTDQTNAFWTSWKSELRAVYTEFNMTFAGWSEQELTVVYNETIRKQVKRINSLKVPVNLSYLDAINTNASKQTLETILSEANASFFIGLENGEKELRRLASMTQQSLVREKAIEGVITESLAETGNLYGVNKALYKELAGKAIDGKYVTVIDKNGNTMFWDVKKYSEMVARTKISEAMADATVNTAIAAGSDLVQVSSHNTLTPFDAQFEGKIFSISGKDPDFPLLTDMPPFHPNCLHVLTVVFKEVLEHQGVLDKYSDFSKGKTDEHPTRKSFVPINKRGF